MVTAKSPWDIKQEICVFLRNNDVLSISTRGVSTEQDTGTFIAANTHTLATNPTLVKNVRNVNVDTTDLTFGTDYTVNYATGVISFTSSQTGDYIIDYDQGTQDRIFPDYPQAYTKISAVPRVGFDIISGLTEELALGGGANITEYIIKVIIYDDDISNVDVVMNTLRKKVMEGKKTFYIFPFITPTAMGTLLPSGWGNGKIFQRDQNFLIRRVVES